MTLLKQDTIHLLEVNQEENDDEILFVVDYDSDVDYEYEEIDNHDF